VWGWDEAFMEVHGDPEQIARIIQRAVKERTRLSCSIGIGDNKLRAKTATGFGKPAGVGRLTAREWLDVMGERPTVDLWGIGRKSARRLADIGIGTVRELAEADDEQLAASFGPRIGPWLGALARGEDDSPVISAPRRARSRSKELTFDEDVDDPDAIAAQVKRMVLELAAYCENNRRRAVGVAVKLRFAPFITRSHSRRLKDPSSDAASLIAAAEIALARFDIDRPVRLVGVRLDLD
jgi:DNA polymerase-4